VPGKETSELVVAVHCFQYVIVAPDLQFTLFRGCPLSALDSDRTYVTHFIRKLRGGSQPILAQASDGFLYVVKFTNNPQGRNISFNEAMGTELYQAAGLPVPVWKPLVLTEEFLNRNNLCWIETAEGFVRPESGLCFGSRYLGGDGEKLWEILPRSSFARIANAGDFYLAWLVDICAAHTDNRQAVFEDRPGGIQAVFVDHGHMFSGPEGMSPRPNYRASAYLDMRIYERTSNIAQTVLDLDGDTLLRRAKHLPTGWLTDTALRNFSECLGLLADAKAVESIVELIAGFPVQKDQREFLADKRQRGFPDWLLRAGVQCA
jgi:hypothetical protein